MILFEWRIMAHSVARGIVSPFFVLQLISRFNFHWFLLFLYHWSHYSKHLSSGKQRDLLLQSVLGLFTKSSNVQDWIYWFSSWGLMHMQTANLTIKSSVEQNESYII